MEARQSNSGTSRASHYTDEIPSRRRPRRGYLQDRSRRQRKSSWTGEGRYDSITKFLLHFPSDVLLETLCYMASRLRADIILMRMKKGLRGKIAEVMVRANQRDGIKLDVRVMVLGDIGAGKSTLIGVLTSGRPDNGKGRARSTVCFHKHERYTGRTSSIYHHIVGFNSQGKITNHEIFSNSWAQIIDLSTKIVTFIDIGGAEKYAKLIIYGLCSLYPDYVLLVVSASNGVTKNTEDKISLAFQFKVPLVVVMTHCDVATNDQVETTEEALRYLLKRYQKYPIGVRDVTDVVESSRWLKENVTPLFKISSTNVASLEHFITFLNLLPVKDDWSSKKMLSSEFFISDIFEVEGKSIIGGTVIKGVVRKQHPLYLGPGVRGDFIKVNVESVQCKRVQVRSAACGQSCTLALKFTEQGKEWLKLNTLRRGMVLVDGKLNPRAAYEFLAEMMLFEGTAGDSERKLTKNYEPVIHSQTTRQACSLISASEISMPAPMDALSRKRSHSSESKFKHREDHHEHRGESSPEEGNKYQIFVLGKKKVFPSTNNLAQSQIMKIAEVPEEETNDSPTFTQQQPNSTESPTIVGSKLTRKTASSRPRKLTETIEERKEVIEENREYVLSVKPNRSFLLRLRFKYNPEYVTLGQKIIINDSKLRAIGFVKEIYY
eukprot:TRINITY_DN4836_c0_g3_i3.p1 TRINITY_DN4836_c0_g3~~TRINITY_DN4836_c0_g3_i3.p1  ORF type:complete len:661 (-),score=113.15 TRINITY_DN4836_c0_g3_i3:53-2035(-)